MIMADVVMYALIIGAAYLVLFGYWLLAEALFPNFVERCRLRYERVPVRSTVIGIVVAAPLLAGGVALFAHMGNPVFQIAGVAVVALVAMLGLVGSAGLCRQIGRGLPMPHDAAQPWRQAGRGALVLGLILILPFIGWFVFLPLLLLSGFGVWLGVRFRGKQPAAPAT